MKLATHIAFFFCLLFLAGAPAVAGCSLIKVTQMPLVELGAHYAVDVQIEDGTYPMIVDSGAAVTTLNASFADKHHLKPDEASLATLRPVVGIGQTTGKMFLNAIPSVLGLGDLVFHDRSTVVADMEFKKIPEEASVGLIGDDILSQYDVEFDFAAKTLSFYSRFTCYDTFIPWTGSYARIPFDHHDEKIVIDVALNDERTRAIVDTGNNVSFVTRKSPVLWDVPEDALVPTKAQSSSPLNGGTSQSIKLVIFEKMKINGENFSRRPIGVIDVDLITGTANLGLDYFKDHKLWIAYPDDAMFVSREPSLSKLAYPVIEKKKPVSGEKPIAAASD